MTDTDRRTWMPDSPDHGPPLYPGEVRVIAGIQVIARPSTVGDHLVWTNLEQQLLPVKPLPPDLAVRLTRAHWTQVHIEMLRRNGDEARFRPWMDEDDLPAPPSHP